MKDLRFQISNPIFVFLLFILYILSILVNFLQLHRSSYSLENPRRAHAAAHAHRHHPVATPAPLKLAQD